MNKKCILIGLLILAVSLLHVSSTTLTDFTLYPEDKSLAFDFIGTTDEVFYGSWYFSNLADSSANYIDDKRNGVRVKAWQGVRINTYF